MPIIGLTDQTAAYPIIGQLRKGEEKKQENRPGKDLTYFRFTSEDKLAYSQFYENYSAEPRQINIFLPCATTDENIDAWLEHWVAGGLKTRCDGQTIVLQQQNDGSYSSEPQKCSRNCQCKQVGRLPVIIPELGRFATVTVLTTSIHDIMNLTKQLRSYEAIRGDLRGIPFILTRSPVKISTPSGKNGGRARREKWLLSIETQPAWTMRQLQAMERAALPELDDGIIEGEALSLPEPSPKFISAENAPDTNGDTPEPEPEPETNGRPYAPQVVREKINAFIDKFAKNELYQDQETGEYLPIKLHPFGEKTPNLLAAKMEEAFKGLVDNPKEAYRTVLDWLFFTAESANDLTAVAASALFKMLFDDTKPGWDSEVLDVAKEELLAIYEVAASEGEANGETAQAEMPLDTPQGSGAAYTEE